MLIKITFQITVLIFSTILIKAQYFESVGEEAERILISLSDGDSINPSEFNELNNLISSEINDQVYGSYPDVNQKNIDSLKNHLNEFEAELKNIPTDSAFVLFNDWFLHFQSIFYDCSKQKFFSSSKQKILFFSTSMSCYCTLKMSRIQTAEILKFLSEYGDKYDYWIIDSYWHNELQIKYETLFAPSVMVFDGNNQVIYKIEYENKMIDELKIFFHNELRESFMNYKMSETENGLNIIIEVSNDIKTKLLEEFSNCQQRKCSCPTEEYKKLESLTVENFENKISLTLKPKADQNFDISEINNCLNYTSNKVEEDK